jgi:hypothetical protein
MVAHRTALPLATLWNGSCSATVIGSAIAQRSHKGLCDSKLVRPFAAASACPPCNRVTESTCIDPVRTIRPGSGGA